MTHESINVGHLLPRTRVIAQMCFPKDYCTTGKSFSRSESTFPSSVLHHKSSIETSRNRDEALNCETNVLSSCRRAEAYSSACP